jgi:DNA-binding NarL/FixJ family response regulator
MDEPISVVIVDDHQLFRQSLKIMISRWEGISTVGETGEWKKSLDIIEEKQPTLAILDISMPGLGGIELAPRIRKLSPTTQIMILSMHGDSNHVYRAFKAGCRGFVLKSDSAEELEMAIRTVARRKTFLSPSTSSLFINKLISQTEDAEGTIFTELTQREQEIGRQLLQRRSTTDIGKDLCISPKTVRVHITNMMKKLSCHSRDELTFRLQEMLSPVS